jgi:hypothetical protein
MLEFFNLFERQILLHCPAYAIRSERRNVSTLPHDYARLNQARTSAYFFPPIQPTHLRARCRPAKNTTKKSDCFTATLPHPSRPAPTSHQPGSTHPANRIKNISIQHLATLLRSPIPYHHPPPAKCNSKSVYDIPTFPDTPQPPPAIYHATLGLRKGFRGRGEE